MHHNVGTLERITSLALGGAALAAFLKRPGLSRSPVALGGAAFLYRGVTGHCPLKAAALGDGGFDDGDELRDGGSTAALGRQPAPRRAGTPEESWRERKDLVQEASEESFPASDPPSFNPGVAD